MIALQVDVAQKRRLNGQLYRCEIHVYGPQKGKKTHVRMLAMIQV